MRISTLFRGEFTYIQDKIDLMYVSLYESEAIIEIKVASAYDFLDSEKLHSKVTNENP